MVLHLFDAQRNRLLYLCFFWIISLGAPIACQAQTIEVDLPGGAKMDMILVPPGSFFMGSPESESDRESNEGPRYVEIIQQPFYLAKYELTQKQWVSVMGTRPWAGKSFVQNQPNFPAVYISHEDAQIFVARLNAAAGDSLYRLPTEAEWEYACRAGTETPWSSGATKDSLTNHAWYRKNLKVKYARTVGMRAPNPWGFYDMHGNVWEWVLDPYGPYGGPPGSDYVNRGGSFYDPARRLRSAYRNHDSPNYQSADTGLRLLRRIP